MKDFCGRPGTGECSCLKFAADPNTCDRGVPIDLPSKTISTLKGNTMYIVIWSLVDRANPGNLIDFWQPHENLDQATKFYEALLEHSDIYTASICGVMRSTDYDAAPKG